MAAFINTVHFALQVFLLWLRWWIRWAPFANRRITWSVRQRWRSRAWKRGRDWISNEYRSELRRALDHRAFVADSSGTRNAKS